MAFLPSQLTLLFITVAASSTAGLPFFEGYYQPAYYYPNMRFSRSAPATAAVSGVAGAGASAYAGSSAKSSSGTHVAAGPGGSGAFNAFAGTGPANDFGLPGFDGSAGHAYGGFGYGGFPEFSFPSFDFNRFFQQYRENFQEAQRRAQEAAASAPGSSNEVGVGATASGEYSPGGGYGDASVFPGAPNGVDLNFGGLDDRFGGAGSMPVNRVSGSFAPPGSSHFGVFTSSSSHSSNVDGKVTSHKMATVGIDDNGKVTTYTAHDP